jgi:beta-phosphoglucomutase-like phosphatase (HAD superfamily)
MPYEKKEGTKGLIFDLDGTLADTMPLHLKAWKIACQEFGIIMTDDFLKSFTGTPGRKIAEALVRYHGLENSVDTQQIAKRKHDLFDDMQPLVTIIKPVADIVNDYYGQMPMAIGTGGQRDTVERTLEVIGMKEFFYPIITADDVTNYKPDPETFIRCAELMKINPYDIEVFEDGDLGIEAARSAGMHPVDVRTWYDYIW